MKKILLFTMVALLNAVVGLSQVQATFVERTGSSNPFDGFDVGGRSIPTFVDLDGDGDLDMVSGESYGTFKYYQNDGGVFTEQTGSSNPFDGFDVGFYSFPDFVDLDGDGDLDMVSGWLHGTFKYFQNDGGVFTEQTGSSNPLGAFDAGLHSTPVFVDLDGDGDLDMVSGESYGTFKYYQNDAGVFTEQTGSSNPLDGFNVGSLSTPTFVDFDGDGDLDMVSGENAGVFNYYQNDAGVFTVQTGSSNPLDTFDVGSTSTPTFADFDGDGDLDLVSGESNGGFKYYENTTPLPPSSSSTLFVERTGSSNPFDGFDVGDRSTPTFVDLDGDGDPDLVSGESNGTFKYYQNDGGVFTEQTGSSNPLDTLDVSSSSVPGSYSVPTFVDLDGDGDLDMVSGESNGTFKYYQNDGGTFTKQTGSSNPLDTLDVGTWSAPTFADFDGDGDLDMVSGEIGGAFNYYQNDAGVFTEQTGSSNPFDGLAVVATSQPRFVDLDGDGDLDMVSGEYYGTFKYYRNDGGVFTEQTGSSNPLDTFVAGTQSTPVFVDLDGDGDLDMVSGESNGGFKYYENTTAALPVELLAFTARATGASNTLQWVTGSEENNEGFQVERSADGRSWETIGFVAGAGTTLVSQSYDYRDAQPLTGLNYYRLKQVDFDGAHEYSRVITIRRKAATAAPVLFPNPVTDQLTIQHATAGIVTLTNALGQPVGQWQVTHSPFTVEVSGLPRGLYTATIQLADGSTHTEMLVK